MHVALLTHQLTPLFHLRSKESQALRGPFAAHAETAAVLVAHGLDHVPGFKCAQVGTVHVHVLVERLRAAVGVEPLLDQQAERVGGESLKAEADGAHDPVGMRRATGDVDDGGGDAFLLRNAETPMAPVSLPFPAGMPP